MSPPAIAVQKLTKRYGRLTAVSNLTFEVQQGEIFGFLGLNGAGKTTTIRILLDLLRPNAGSAAILGFDCRRESLKVRTLVGYMPGEVEFFGSMSGNEVLTLLDRLQRRPAGPRYRRELQERLQLSNSDLRRPLREYSTGMKRKLCLIQALQGDPPLLILDEPTEGLDPLVQESFYELLLEAKGKGRTIFMSSHVLSEVERMCERIALIRSGELALLASIDELHKMARRKVRVTFSADVTQAPQGLPPECVVVEAGPRFWHFRVRGEIGILIQSLGGLPVSDVDVTEARLEEVLIRYYREDPL